MKFRALVSGRRGNRRGKATSLTGLLPGGLSLALVASMFVFGVVAATTVVDTVKAPPAAAAAGTPVAGPLLWSETFGTSAANSTADRVDTFNSGAYDASPYWLKASECNGYILSGNTTSGWNSNCNGKPSDQLKQMAYALSMFDQNSASAPSGSATNATALANNAVTAYTRADNVGCPSNESGSVCYNSLNTATASYSQLSTIATEFRTRATRPITVPGATNKFLVFSVDAAAFACISDAANSPRFQWYLLDASGAQTLMSSAPNNVCADGQSFWAPAIGGQSAVGTTGALKVGRFSSDLSFKATSDTFGIQLVNLEVATNGNDSAYDNIRVYDGTPQLEKTFTPGTIGIGGTSVAKFTITNTSDLAQKLGYGFTDTLAAGLKVASTPNITTKCYTSAGAVSAPQGFTVTAAAGGNTIAIAGDLARGQAYCTVEVSVTATTNGPFSNSAANITNNQFVYVPTESATLTVDSTGPTLTSTDKSNLKGQAITPVAIATGSDPNGPVTYTATNLPPGLTVASDGTVTGTPTTPGAYTVTVTAKDKFGNASTTTFTWTITELKPNLNVTKSANVPSVDGSGSVTYTYNLTNNNTALITAEALKTVSVTDDKCSPVTYSSGDANSNNLLESGETWVYKCTTTIPGASEPTGVTSVTNTATAKGTPVTTSTTPVTATAKATVRVLRPNLNVSKTAGTSTGPNANGIFEATYTVTVTNTGDGTGYYGPLTDTPSFDPNLTLTGSSWTVSSSDNLPWVGQASGSTSGVGPTYPIGSANTYIKAGVTHTYQVTITYRFNTRVPVTACAGAGTGLFNSIALAGEQGPSTDNTACMTSAAPSNPSLTLTKSASAINDLDGNGHDVGDTITYSFSIKNTGNVNLSNVVINDTKLGLTNFACAAGPVAPNATTACTATRTYTLTQGDIDAGSVINNATATATPPSMPTVTSAVSSTSTSIVPKLGLTMSKAANKPVDVNNNGVTDPGDTITYTFTVTNTGNTTLTPVRITDTKLSATPFTCAASLAPGVTTTCTSQPYTVTTGDQTTGAVNNSATATGTSGSNTVTTPASTTSTKVASAASLDISKAVTYQASTVDPRTGNFTVTYNLVVTNAGETPTTYGPVIDTPAAAPNITVLRGEWTGPGITGVATQDGAGPYTLSTAGMPIAGNSSATYSIRLVLRFTDMNTAVACDGPGTGVYNTGSLAGETGTSDNNGACATPPVTPPTPKLKLTKTAGTLTDVDASGSATVGDKITYSFSVENTGNVDITDVAVSDPKLALQGITISCTPTTLQPGGTASCTTSKAYEISQTQVDAGSITNTASASGAPVAGTLAADPASTPSTTTALNAGPSIWLDKKYDGYNDQNSNGRIDLGDEIRYAFDVKNTGNVTLSSVTVTDPKLGTISCGATSLAPLATTTCTTTSTIKVGAGDVTAGKVTNTATASGTPPKGAAVTMQDNVETTVVDPKISMIKSVKTITDVNGNGRNDAGDTVTYSFVVSNDGNQTLTGISISDPKVGGATCPTTTLAPGVPVTCTSTSSYTISGTDAGAGSFINTATVSANPPTGTPITATGKATTTTQLASLTIEKTAREPVDTNGNGRTDAGDTVIFDITVTNTGNQTLDPVTVTDPLVTGAGGTLTCSPTVLTSGQSTTCVTSAYLITAADASRGSVVNTAFVNAKPAIGTAITGSKAVTVPIQRAGITIDKTHTAPVDVNNNGRVDAGDTITYSFLVTNTGNETVTQVSVSDSLLGAGAVTCPKTTLSGGESTTCTADPHVIKTADETANQVVNTATVSAQPATGTAISGKDTDTQAVDRVGFTFTKKAKTITDKNGNGRNDAGDLIAYEFTITNTGNLSLSSLVIADDKITGTGTSDASCDTLVLAPGASATCTGVAPYTITTGDETAGSVVNIANATVQPAKGTSVTKTATDTVVVQTSGITLDKTHADPVDGGVTPAKANGRVDAGDTVVYTFTVTNNGNTPIRNVVINDPKVTGVTCVPAEIAPGADATCTSAPYTITAAEATSGTVTNTATATAQPVKADGSALGTPVTSASDNDAIAAVAASLTFSKRATSVTDANSNGRNDAGDTINYEIVVTNTGQTKLDPVSIDDALATLSCPATSVDAGKTLTCTATHKLTDAEARTGSFTNTATVTAQPVSATGDPLGDVLTDTKSASTNTAVSTLSIVKSHEDPIDANNNGRIGTGDTIVYKFLVTNTGTVTVNSLTISDPTLASVNCPKTTLTPGEATTCTSSAYTITHDEALAGTVLNTATAIAQPTIGTAVSQKSNTVAVPAVLAEVTLFKRVDYVSDTNSNGTRDVGDVINYAFDVSNVGNLDITALSFVDANADPVTCPANWSPLKPKTTVTCTASHEITPDDGNQTFVYNEAVVWATPTQGDKVSASDNVTVGVNAPSLDVVKSVAGIADKNSTLRNDVGDTITYQFVITNTGTKDLYDVWLAEIVDYDSTTCPVQADPRPELKIDASFTCTVTYTVTRTDAETGSVNNTGTVSGTYLNDDGEPVTPALTKQSNQTVTPVIDAQLAIVKSAAPYDDKNGNGRADSGDTITYSFEVTNNSTVRVTDVTVSDPQIGATLSCDPSALDPGGVATCATTYTLTQADAERGTIDNTAIATAQPVDGGGVAIGNPASASSNQVSTKTMDADASIEKAMSFWEDLNKNGRVDIGDKLNYTITVTNTGSVELTNVEVTDPPVDNLSCTPPAPATLAKDATLVCTASHTISSADGTSFSNTASFTAEPPAGGGNTLSGDSEPVTTTIENSSITLVKKLDADPDSAHPQGWTDENNDGLLNTTDKLYYAFAVTNNGNVAVASLAISDPLIGAVTCPATIAAGVTVTCYADNPHTVTAAEYNARVYANTATASAQPLDADGKPTGNPVTDTKTLSTTIDHPALTVTKTHKTPVADTNGNGRTGTGDIVEYQFVVTNSGNLPLENVTLTDLWADPNTSVPDPDKPIATTCTPTTPATLAVGATLACTATYQMLESDSAAGRVRNVATATGTPVKDGTALTNDKVSAEASDVVITEYARITMKKSVASIEDHSPEGEAANGRIGVGDVIHYNFVITNIGRLTLTKVNLTDAKVSDLNCPGVTNGDFDLLPGGSITCTASHTLTGTEAESGSYVNTAKVTALPSKGAAVEDTSQVIQPTEDGRLTLEKTAGAIDDANGNGKTDAGDTIDYTFSVDALGNLTQTDITVTDAKLGLTDHPCVKTITPTDAPKSCTITYTLTQADLDAGEVENAATATGHPRDADGNLLGTPTTASSQITSTVEQSLGFTVQKSAGVVIDANGSGVQDEGDTISYTFTLTNTGTVTLKDLKINDPKLSAAPINCLATLAQGATASCSPTQVYTLTQDDVDKAVVVNAAAATAVKPDDTVLAAVEPAKATTGIDTTGDLAIVKTPTLNDVTDLGRDSLGDTIGYSFTVTNNTNVTVNNVLITDPLLGLTDYPCGTGDLAPGASVECTPTDDQGDPIVYTVTVEDMDAGKVVNTATVAADLPGTGTAKSAEISVETTLTAKPSITGSKKHTLIAEGPQHPVALAGKPYVGDTVAYTFTIKNTGNVTLNNVYYTDPLLGSGTFTCTLTSLEPDQETTCTSPSYTLSQADLDQKSGTLVNNAEVSGEPVFGDRVVLAVSDTLALPESPSLKLDKQAQAPVDRDGDGRIGPGDTITFVFEATNTGNVTMNLLGVTDPMVGLVTCPPRGMLPGAKLLCSAADYVITQDDVDNGGLTNQADLVGYSPKGTEATSTDTEEVTIQGITSMAMTKAADDVVDTDVPANGTPDVGDTIVYSFTVTNTGTASLNDVAIDDPLVTDAGGRIDCPTTPLKAGESMTCTSTPYALTQDQVDAFEVTNAATVTATSPAGVPACTDTGPGTDGDSCADSIVTKLNPVSDLTMTKTVDPDNPINETDGDGILDAGESLNYIFVIENTGATTLDLIQVKDELLGGLAINCTPTKILPDAKSKCSAAPYPLSQQQIDNGTLRNSATGFATGPDGTVYTKQAENDYTITPVAKVDLLKSAGAVTDTNNDGLIGPGDEVNYFFEVTNTGNVSLQSITVSDPMLGGVNCPDISLGHMQSVECKASGPVRLSPSDFDNGKIVNTATVAALAADGTRPTNKASVTKGLPQVPDYTITKSVDPATDTNGDGHIGAGDKTTYHFVITNTGNVTLTDVTFDDPTLSIADRTCARDTIGFGQSVQCQANVTLDQTVVDAGGQTNTVTATATPPTGAAIPRTGGAVLTIVPEPDLVLEKTDVAGIEDTDNSGDHTAGDTVRYTFSIRNMSNVTLRDVMITDSKVSPDDLLCTAGPVAPFEKVECDLAPQAYPVAQDDIDSGYVRNEATAHGVKPDKTEVTSPPAFTALPAIRTPLVSFEKWVKSTTDTTHDGKLAVGDSITYGFKVKNIGNVDLAVPTIQDVLLGGRFECGSIVLAPDDEATCERTLVLTAAHVDLGAVLRNSASVTAPPRVDDGVLEPATETDVADQTLTRTSSMTLAKSAVVDDNGLPVITDTNGDGKVTAGDTMEFTFTVTNTGTTTLNEVWISDPRIGVSKLACGADPLPADDPITTSNEGERSCSVSYVVTQGDVDAGIIRNSATVSAVNPDGADVTATGSTIASIDQDGQLLATKSHQRADGSDNIVDVDGDGRLSAGDQVIYTFTLINQGTVSLAQPQVDDPKLSAPVTNCAPAPIAPGGTATCSAAYTVTQSDVDKGEIVNAGVTASATFTNDGVQQTVSSPKTADTLTFARVASARLTKTALVVDTDVPANGTPDAGDQIRYGFAITNTGSVTLSKPTVTDSMLGLSAVPCAVDSIAPGATVSCFTAGDPRAVHTLTQDEVDAGALANTASISATPPEGLEPVTSGGSATTPLIDLHGGLSMVKSIAASGVVDADGSGTHSVGDTIQWRFTVTNTSNRTVSAVTVTDQLLKLTDSPCGSGPLAPGESRTCDAPLYRLTQADLDAGGVTNTATASATRSGGGTLTSSAAASRQPLVAVSGLTLKKTAGDLVDVNRDGVQSAGDRVSYQFTLTNTGNVTLSDLTITDAPLGMSGVACGTGALAPGASRACSADYTVKQGEVDLGQLVNTATGGAKSPQGVGVAAQGGVTTAIAAAPAARLDKSVTRVVDENKNKVTDPGDRLYFQFTITNTGNVTLAEVAVTDAMVGMEATPCGTNLAPGAKVTCRDKVGYTITAADAAKGEVVNNATVVGVATASQTIESEGQAVIKVQQTPRPTKPVKLPKPPKGHFLPSTGAPSGLLPATVGGPALMLAGLLLLLLARRRKVDS